MQPVVVFKGTKSEFTSYLAGMKSGKVVDLAWCRAKRKNRPKRAADKKSIFPSIA